MKKLAIIGASGHGKVCADIALKMNQWQDVVFLDDDENMKPSIGLEVIGNTFKAITIKNEFDIFVGIGNNAIRKKIQQQLESDGASIVTLLHPTSIIGAQVEIESGTVVMAGVVINACTKIGAGCIINTAASIDHDCNVQDFVHISPGVRLAGNVTVGEETWLGIGSIVSNNITITSNVQVGAGGVVVKDLIKSGTYIGVPVQRIHNQ